MLIKFSVENFLSFKEKTTFSLMASTDRDKEDNYAIIRDKKILKTAAFFGANASGKTNLLRAFSASILLVRNSNVRQINEKLNLIQPFAFDDIKREKPSSFEYEFINNGRHFLYGFSANQDYIITEYLYEYKSSKATRIFEKLENGEYKYLQSEERKLRAIEGQNTPNKLFLSTATLWNYEETKDAYNWFEKGIDTYEGGVVFSGPSAQRYEEDFKGDRKLKEFAIKLLKLADIQIDDYQLEVQETSIDNNLMNVLKMMNPQAQEVPQKQKVFKVDFIHKIKNGNKEKKYLLNLNQESLGTQILFTMAPSLMDALQQGKVIYIDEIERSLHPELVGLIVKLFNDPKNNPNNAQLIFNTHSSGILSKNVLRRDQIWLIEKDKTNEYTTIKSLNNIEEPPRKNDNFEKGYREGKYGGIPNIEKEIDLWKV